MSNKKNKIEDIAVAAPIEMAVEKDYTVIAKDFWTKYSKIITGIGTAVILICGAYLAYKYFVKIPKNQKASESIFPAEKLFDKMATTSSFNKDTVNIVLNGGTINGENITGLLKIVNNFGGTPSGNRAEYLVGACYLQLKQFDKAISHLKEFNANGANQIQSKAYIMLGHAYAEQKKVDDALSYYKKAGSVDEADQAMSSEAYFLAGVYADAVGKTSDAIEIFQKLKNNFGASAKVTSGEVDKYLAKLGK